MWSVFDVNYRSACCELHSSPLLHAVYPSDEKGRFLAGFWASCQRRSASEDVFFPKQLTSIREEQWIFTSPFVFWLFSCCRRCFGSASLILKRSDLALAHTVCSLCSRHKLVVFFYFWLGDHVFLAASGACFWQSGLLCGLSALLFLIKIIFTREEWRSAHRHCWGETRWGESEALHPRSYEVQTPLSSLRYQCFNSSLRRGMKRHRSIYRGSRLHFQ